MMTDSLTAQIYDLRWKIAYNVHTDSHRIELQKLLRTATNIVADISREDIICRRHGRDTQRAVTLKQQFADQIEIIEQQLVMAMLLNT